MKKSIVAILIIISNFCHAQNLTLNQLLSFCNKNADSIEQFLVKQKWENKLEYQNYEKYNIGNYYTLSCKYNKKTNKRDTLITGIRVVLWGFITAYSGQNYKQQPSNLVSLFSNNTALCIEYLKQMKKTGFRKKKTVCAGDSIIDVYQNKDFVIEYRKYKNSDETIDYLIQFINRSEYPDKVYSKEFDTPVIIKDSNGSNYNR